MYTSNRERRKRLILAYPDTRRIYRTIQVLLFFLIASTFITFCISKWSEYKLIEQKNLLFGEWDEVFVNLTNEDLSYFDNHAFVEKYGIQKIHDRVYINDKRIIVGSCDEDFFELGNLKMISGRLPTKGNEVAIEEEYLSMLGVKNVGDYISEDAPILSGYKVCGILNNYTSTWNMVNRDVKFANCIIEGGSEEEVQLIAKFSSNSQIDIDLNFLNHKSNVQFQDISIIWKIIKLWIIVLFIIVIEGVRLFLLYKRRVKNKVIMAKKSLLISKNKNDWMYKGIIAILDFCFIFIILFLIEKLVSDLNYLNNTHIDIVLNSILDKSIYDKGNGNIILNINNGSRIIFCFQNKIILSVLDTILMFMWLFLINWIIVLVKINYFKKFVVNNMKWRLANYYYKRDVLKDKRKEYILNRIIKYVLLTFIIILFKIDTLWNGNIILIIILAYLGYTIFLIVNCAIIKSTLRCLENSTDWLLMDESE